MVDTQLTMLVDILKTSEIVGRAMLTIVPSRDDMKVARDIEMIRSVNPFLRAFAREVSISFFENHMNKSVTVDR